MTTPAAAATQTKPAAGKTGGNQPPPPKPWPFPVGVYDNINQDYDVTLTQTTSAQQLSLWNISPTSWLRGLWFDFAMTITGQSTNSVSYSGDNPWSVIQKMTLYDIGHQVVIQLTGYDWMTVNKFGGYFAIGDPRADIQYSASTGTGSTAGTFHFNLYLPFEVVGRNSLGVVENKSKPGWQVEIYIDSQANTYNQVPSVQGSLRVRGYPDAYTKPADGSGGGRPYAQTPPRPGTLQRWQSENQALSAGNAKYDLTNGIGFAIRNIFYKVIDTSAGTRASGDSDWPDPFQLLLGNVSLRNVSKNVFLTNLARDFGLTSTTADAALGRENGVFPQYFTQDWELKAGGEAGLNYLRTEQNTLLRLQGSWGAANTLYALVNWIVDLSNNQYAMIGA